MRVLPRRLFSRRTPSLNICALAVCVLTLSCWATSAALGQDASSSPSGRAMSQAGAARAPQLGAVAPAKVTSATAVPKAGNGTHQGIKINGYWKIDIHNPDGTLAKHLEFENSLTTPRTVALVLSGNTLNLGPSIIIRSSASDPEAPYFCVTNQGSCYPTLSIPGPCGTVGGLTSDCLLTAAANPIYNNCLFQASTLSPTSYISTACVGNLTVSTGSDTNDSLTLNGSITIAPTCSITTCSIGSVSTMLTGVSSSFASTVSMPNPVGSSPIPYIIPGLLTGYTLPSSQPVTGGQVVTVSVTLSFH